MYHGGRLSRNLAQSFIRTPLSFGPLCMCDEDVGYVEARYLDQVVRGFETSNIEPGSGHSGRLYRYGAVPLGDGAARTLKLG